MTVQTKEQDGTYAFCREHLQNSVTYKANCIAKFDFFIGAIGHITPRASAYNSSLTHSSSWSFNNAQPLKWIIRKCYSNERCTNEKTSNI